MTRAEMRRIEKEKSKKTNVYTLTQEQIDKIKADACDEAASTAFLLMLGIPLLVLHDKYSLIMKKETRLKNFSNEVLKLFDSWQQGYLTLDDMREVLEKEANITWEDK